MYLDDVAAIHMLRALNFLVGAIITDSPVKVHLGFSLTLAVNYFQRLQQLTTDRNEKLSRIGSIDSIQLLETYFSLEKVIFHVKVVL